MGALKPAWGPRTFDPVRLGNQETDAWASYYRREWAAFLRAAVGMVRTGFGTGPVRTLVGAYHVLRANRLWAPYPDNDPDGARASMERFYAMVAKDGGFPIDPRLAAHLEVEWWRLHREHQHDPAVSSEELVQSLVDLYSYLYGAPREAVHPAAEQRVVAMGHSDAWVAGGCRAEDPDLLAERRALVASYSALRSAVGHD